MRGGASQPGLPLVLPARPGWRGARPLDLLQEPTWPLPRQRSAARVFETVVRRCMEEGLVGGEGFAVDASLIKADANRQRSLPESMTSTGRPSPGRAVRSGSISTRWMMPPWAPPASRRRSSSRRPDPAARWTGAHKGQAFFAYSDNYLIDLDRRRSSSMSRPPRAIRQAEVGAAST